MSDTPITPDASAQDAPPAPQSTPAQDAPKVFDAAYVDELRKEAAKYRTELRKLQTAREAEENATLSEVERAKREAATLAEQYTATKQALRAERARLVVMTEAQALGLDGSLAAELLTPDKLEYDDDDKPKSVKSALKALADRFPALAGSQARTANPARGGLPTETDAQRRARLSGGGGLGFFDPETAERLGGGVRYNS